MNLFPSSSRPRAFGVVETSRCLEAKPRFGASLVHYAHDCETGLITGDSLRPSPFVRANQFTNTEIVKFNVANSQ